MMYKIKKSPSTSRSKKIARLDIVFSKFIRRRDCGFGYGRCISCGAVITYETSDAGHFYNRANMSTRFEEQNVHAQCRHCNRFREGQIQGYRIRLIEKIGVKAVDMLEIKKFNICHLSEVEIDILTAYYKKKLKDIET